MRYLNRLLRREIRIRDLKVSHHDGGSRVGAVVDGEEVWFRSSGAALAPEWTAFAAAYFVCAQRLRLRLRVDGPLAPGVMDGLQKVAELHDHWWQSGPCPAIQAERDDAAPMPGGRRTGLFFSCGMDSLDALLEHHEVVDDLVLVHGFDVALGERLRFAGLRAKAEAVSRATGKRLVVIETNIREHRLFKRVGWVRSHGAAMAAVGHLLCGEVSRMLISASHPGMALWPWGSHPLLDHHWSSDSLKFEHVGDDKWRIDKIRRHGGHPLVQQHLTVCWEGRGEPANCGRCEKCVRNQLGFLVAGHSIPASFPPQVSLAGLVLRLSKISIHSSIYSEAARSPHVDAETRRLLRSLIDNAEAKGEGKPEQGAWDRETLASRVSDVSSGIRHQAGSPNPEEIAAYVSHLPDAEACRGATAVVLGMTPELRMMAAARFARVVAVDSSAAAIEQYLNWLPEDLRCKERVYSIRWEQLPYLDWSRVPPVGAVLGDGVFANLADRKAHLAMLRMLHGTFPQAVLVFRKALALRVGDDDDQVLDDLRARFRAGELSADEFGFSVRLQGFLNRHHDSVTGQLDNAALFADCDRLHGEGFFDALEIEAIRRFRFNGTNCLLGEPEWEQLLHEAGLVFRKTKLSGRRWYAYYPVYGCSPATARVRPAADEPG